MSEIEESDFICDELRDYEKYIINAVLDDSVNDLGEDVFTQRYYQDELVDRIKLVNRIVFVPLERDKLHISAGYIKYLMTENCQKRVLYVVESSLHIIDCLSFFRIHLPLSVASLTTIITQEAWQKSCNSNQLFIIPACIFNQMLRDCLFKIREVDLCIFNECIHLSEEHFLEQFVSSKIVVLTSSFNYIGTDTSIFYEWLKKLEITFNSSLITSRSCNLLKKYLVNSMKKPVKFTPTPAVLDHSNNIFLVQSIIADLNFVLSGILRDDLIEVDSISVMLEYLENCLRNYGLYPAFIIASLYQIELERLRLCVGQSYVILSSIISDFNTIRSLLEHELSKNNFPNDAKSVINYSNEKLVKLILLLYTMGSRDKCVIFVKDSKLAQMVTYVFELLSTTNLMSNISVSCVIESSSHCSSEREKLLREKFRRKAFKKFYKGIIKVLVVPWNYPLQLNFVTANWIVYFDLPSNCKDYLISRKYGHFIDHAEERQDHGNRYFFFISKDNIDESYEQNMKLIEGFWELDAFLKEVLERKDMHNTESIFKNFRKSAESMADLTKRYFPLSTRSGKEINLSNAVAVINEFFAQLPVDAFTRSAPRWSIHKIKQGVVGKFQLPLQFTTQIETPIESSPVKNISYIKNIMALEVVKHLYKFGLIDSDLNPAVKNIDRELHDVNLFPYWRGEDDENLRGSPSSFNIVPLNIPEWLSDTSPRADLPCYLHVIYLKPVYVVPESSSRKLYFHNLMVSPQGYGILTRKKLPEVCEFPVYTDLGQVQVRIITNNIVVTPTAEQVVKIFSFHRFIFQDLLNVIKSFLVCDNSNAPSSYSIVPVIPESDGVWSIAWDVVYNLSEKKEIYQPTEQELIHTNYFELTYDGKVATPWYQAPPHRDYIITNVLSECTPNSPFSSPDYQSYSEYYYDKYGLEIKQPLQPLLEAKCVNTNLNCLRPRAQKPGIQRRRGEKIKDFEETLIPEFCILQPFPAVYWYKSMTLVAVLHRLHFALNAETIRQRFASAPKLGSFSGVLNDSSDVLIEDTSCIEELDDLCKPVVPISCVLKDVKKARKNRSNPWRCDHIPMDVDKNIKSSLLEIMAYYDFINPSLNLLTSEITEPCKQIPIKERMEDFCLKFLNIDKTLYPGPKQSDIVQALTARQCNDIVNSERFKIVGTAFLNFAVSFMLYKLYSDLNICQLRSLRQKLTGKRNLYYCGSRMELGSFLKLQDVSISNDWNVGGFCVPEVLVNILKNAEVPPEAIFNVELSRDEQVSGVINSRTRININENMMTYCNEKIKSDNVFSVEAASTFTENINHALVYLGKLCVPENAIVNGLKSLIGVYLLNCGTHSALSLLQTVGLLKQNISISELFLNCDDSDSHAYHFSGFETICERINYKFKSKKLPYSAFIHHSYFPVNYIECNQRLAFLGDTILDLLITTYINETSRHLPTDRNEDLRISLVNDIFYAVLAVRLGLHTFLMYESPYLMEKIDEFVRKQERANHKIIHDDYLFLIEETSSENMGSIDVPKALADIFKATVAAVFLDCNGDMKIVWNVCYRIMQTELEIFSIYVPRNPVRLLLDTDLPVEFRSPRSYQNDEGLVKIILNIEIDQHKRSFFGIGYSKLQAKVIAAKLALKHLNKEFTL